MIALDLFAGIGGWDQTISDRVLGVEFDEWAFRTRKAVGLATLRADIATLDPSDWPANDLLIASPPCQGFSVAGKQDPNDPRNRLVYEPLRWIQRWKPRAIAFEQVPPVLPIWEWYCAELRAMGYSAWCGNLTAEMYGTPQTRKRAILMASLDKEVAPPVPTHSRYHSRTPERLDDGVLPWVSMAEALGWTMKRNSGPAPTLALSGSTSPVGGSGNKAAWMQRGWDAKDGGVRITLAQALILQGFPPDYPVQGKKTRQFSQVGNAIPPPLASAILKALLA